MARSRKADIDLVESRMSDGLFDSAVINQAQDATEFMANVLQASTEYSIIGKDIEGTILLRNEGAHRMYGYEAGEVVGRAKSDLLHTPEDVALGNLAQKVQIEIGGLPLQGDFLQTAKTVNAMVEQLNSFAGEVTRVAREVGTEGKLGDQATVEDDSGTWKDLTDSVSQMAGNLTAQVRNTAEVATVIANGSLCLKITVDVRGEFLQVLPWYCWVSRCEFPGVPRRESPGTCGAIASLAIA